MKNLTNKIKDQVSGQVSDQAWASVSSWVRVQVCNKIWGQTFDRVRWQVLYQVKEHLK